MLNKSIMYKTATSLFFVSSFALAPVCLAPICLADDPAPTFGDIKKKPSLDQLYRSSNIVHKYTDFSMFHYVPKGDTVSEQPDKLRLLFRTKGGMPDGYAERKGEVIFYYNAAGKLVRIQKLAEDP